MVQFDDSFTNARVNELHALEEERQIQSKAPRLGFEYINLKNQTLNPEAISVITETEARKAMAVGFELNQKVLSLAVQNPNLLATQELIQRLEKQRYSVVAYMCSSDSLEHAWARYKDVVNSSAAEKGSFSLDPAHTLELMSTIEKKSDVTELLKKIGGKNNTRRISETISLIFAGSLALRASDIHIEPEENGIRLRYRLDGVLHDIADLDSYIFGRIMSRLKLLSGMVLNVKVAAQDGRFTFNIGEREVEVRSSVIPGAIGESVVMRILDPSVASFKLENIKLNKYIEAALKEELKKPNGLIITTGPTGSGKTTALYAFLREVHEEGKKIITIENPVEYKLDGIVHTQTGDDYTFASGLRAILRQDPDVIMVGEIRDREVAETAIHAAQTGHLVFSTLHTNSAVSGFSRLLDLGVNPQVMGSAINMIIGQRLLRLLCVECKTSYKASPEELSLINEVMADHPYPVPIPKPLLLNKAVGCDVCGGTGFKGRAGVFEGVKMDNAVEEVVLRDPREHTILMAARPQKIPSMLQDGIEKVLSGLTSMPELERVVAFPHSLKNKNVPPLNKNSADGDVDFESHIV